VSAAVCLVIGAGQLAAGHLAPLLRDAGWDVVLVTRRPAVAAALAPGRLRLELTGTGRSRVVTGVRAVLATDPDLPALAARAALFATSVGPDALPAVGAWLAPLLTGRLRPGAPPVNLITFENHRHAPEVLARALVAAEPALAGRIGRQLGLAGSAVWRISSHQRLDRDAMVVRVDTVADTYVDAASLVPGAAPADPAVAGLRLVRPFDPWMTEKLWVFNAGHATAAYLGWLAGCGTVAEAMRVPRIEAQVRAVLEEARAAVTVLGYAPAAVAHDTRHCLDRYRQAALADPVRRVARQPRRKLSPGDRLIGPAVAALRAGTRPAALALAAAAALRYDDPHDPQAVDLQREIRRDGPAEVLATVSALDPSDELSRLICQAYRDLPERGRG